MQQSVSDIIADVRKELDEIQVNGSGFATGTDNTDLDAIIRHNLKDALEFCYTNADLSLLPVEQIAQVDHIHTITSTPENGSAGFIVLRNIPAGKTVYIAEHVLDEGFLRLCYARCKSWSHPVTQPMFWTDPQAARLQNWYSTGTPERPVAYIAPSSESGKQGRLAIALYTLVSAQDDIQIGVINKPAYVESGSGASSSVDIAPQIYGAVITYCAGLTLLTLKDKHAEDLFNQALVKMRVNIPKTK